MTKTHTYELRPTGWETDPAEERYPLSTIDYLCACVWISFAVFFKIDDDAQKPHIADVLKAGLERTLGQARHLCGTIERNNTDDGQQYDSPHSFVKTRDSTVQFVVQYVEDDERFPAYADLERQHFVTNSLGASVDAYSVAPMTYGEKPEAQLDNHPKVAAFKATFVRGGLVFMMHNHHTANDVMGWAGFLHQLAENCAAIHKGPGAEFPPWDPACLDLSMFTKPAVPEHLQVDGPPSPERHPDHKKAKWLLFHLPKSKAAELKKLASPADNSYWISTYDAYEAFSWRVLSRLRAELYRPDPASKPIWGEAVDMRKRCTNPRVPPRIQHNCIGVSISAQLAGALPELTTAEIISKDTPLARLAWYIRQLTNSTTQASLDAALDAVAAVRDKSALCLRCDSFPPMYNFTTDWRDTSVCAAHFGFGRPQTFRHIMAVVTPGLKVIYPPSTADPEADEGPEFCIGVEKEICDKLVADPEWSQYFEYRGVDSEDPDDEVEG